MDAVIPDDQERLDAARGGDERAFSELLRRHQRSVFFLALRMSGGDEQLARDIVQKSFLQAWQHLDGFRGEASFKTWLLRIAGNLCKNELRRAWRHRELVPTSSREGEIPPLGSVGPDAFDKLAHRRARSLLRDAVEALPLRQRSVVLLRLYEDLSFAEIAATCDISTNNAKVNFHHAVRNIRKFLAAQGVAA